MKSTYIPRLHAIEKKTNQHHVAVDTYYMCDFWDTNYVCSCIKSKKKRNIIIFLCEHKFLVFSCAC